MSQPLSISLSIDQHNSSQEFCFKNSCQQKQSGFKQSENNTSCFTDPRFVNIALHRIIAQQKVPYGDLCQLCKLNREYGALAREGLTCTSPRQVDDFSQLQEKYGEQISSMDFSGSKQQITKKNLALIPTYFPNVKLIKIPTTPYDLQDEWREQAAIQALLQCDARLNAKLLMVDCVKICDADGQQFVDDWALLITQFLKHIKKYWKSISMTFRFFRLESLLLVLRQVQDICEEGVFEIRVTILLTMEYLFKQLGSENIITQQKFEEVKNFLSSSAIISKVMISTSMFHRNMEVEMFGDLVDTLKKSPCPSDAIHFAFSKYVITWMQGGTNHFTCRKEPIHLLYQKSLFKNKLLIHTEIQKGKVQDNQRQIAHSFLQRHTDQWIGALEVLNITNYRWMAAQKLVQSEYIRFLHIEFSCFQLKKFTTQGLFNNFPNLLILSLISKDYEADSETLNLFLNQFSATLHKLQAFHFFQDARSHVDKTETLDTTFLQYMPGLVIIDIFTSKWKLDVTKFIEQIKNFRYLDCVHLKMIIESTSDSESEDKNIYQKVQTRIAESVPKLRFINIYK